MKIKKIVGALLLLALFTSCGRNTENDSIESNLQETDYIESNLQETDYIESNLPADSSQITETENTEPQNNGEMFDFVMEKWKTGDTEALYPYLSAEMMSLCGIDTITHLFEDITDTFGEIIGNDAPEITAVDGIDAYSSMVRFEHAEVNISLSLKDAKIYGFFSDIRFTDEFDVMRTGIREHYFQLNGLNAVYTCAENSERMPAVLLIPGSGPCDYNETVGMLSPMGDLALKLAEQGISSLRFEKRTHRFAQGFKVSDGIEKEYLADCRDALAYLKTLENIDGVYLLGHSLGGQIAAALASEDDNIAGMILIMSSARHLADIACDQYTAIAPQRAEEFAQYRDAAKEQTDGTASGQYYYFGLSDAYWASYNTLNTIESIRAAAIPTAIINSTGDNQTFTADISLWSELFSNDDNVSLTVFEDMSHLGYKIDMQDQSQLYKSAEMPDELIDVIVKAIR